MDASDATREPDEETFALKLRRGRVHGPGRESLEQRLAIASILAAAGPTPEQPRLGRLEVQSRIGSGGMGVVYRAYDPELGRLVAVKLLRGFSERARRVLIAEEARALARLSHPNVVAVYDIVDSDRELYFVMEYVAGGTLRGWLDTHPEATWREVLDWFVQAGRGLSAAHGAGIVHQDFKPENVLVGTDGRVRVADFGLARSDGEADGVEGGTPYYMAPEAKAGRPATAASDQYSYCKALSDALPRAGGQVPASVLHAIERGTREDPSERHASLAALVETLEEALDVRSETRTRTMLLERVERLWLSGVLDRSLGGGGAIELGLREAPELVEPPFRDFGITETAPRTISSRELQHALNESHGSLLITGPPGSGKTTLLLLLCRELWRTSTLFPEAPAPAVLSLSTYEPETRAGRSLSEHFGRWVVDELVTKYGLPRPTVRRWFDESGIVLLLDGLDETDSLLRGRVVETLNRFREDHPLPMVVTCRDTEYEAIDARLAFGGAVRVQPLDDAGVTNLVEERRALHLMTRLAREETLRDELRNPLMLTLYASTEGLEATDAPGWTVAYEQYVDKAFAGTSPGERAKLEAQLGFLARTMRRHNTSDLWLERLHFGWLEQRWEVIAAYVTGIVCVLLFGVGLNLAQVPLTGDPLASALTFGLGVSITSFAYTRGRIKPVERLRWSWRRALRLLPITTACAAVVGLAEALRVNFAANMVGAAITGAILALVFALEAGDTAARVRPNAGIRRSLDYALGVSFGFGVPVGLLFAFVINPHVTRPLIVVVEHTGNPSLVVGVAVGLFVLTALFLIYGGFTVIMHWVLRLWLAWRTPLPLALARMLGRAAELGLMRRVGGGHVFLHRTLLDYFADGTAPESASRRQG